jgi:hypothetical protein
VLALIKAKYQNFAADSVSCKSMAEARDQIVSFIEASPVAEADAVAVVDGSGWHSINATGAVKDKESAIRKILAVAAKSYAPVLVVVASSKRDADKPADGTKLKNYVAQSEKFVELYKCADGMPRERLFVNTTYESDEKIIGRIMKKAKKAVRLSK